MLKVKLLDHRANAPTVAHPGDDLAYDLYALEPTVLLPGTVTKVRTGIAAVFEREFKPVTNVVPPKFGLLIRDRSSMAAKGIRTSGGVIDAGYRGEILVLLTLDPYSDYDPHAQYFPWGYRDPYQILGGDKIAQMIPMSVQTGFGVQIVENPTEASRGAAGFGSSGR